MAGRLLDVNEAAKFLGVKPDLLSELRQRGDIRGLRDGASWKFKQEDLEHYLADRAGGESGSKYDQDFEQPAPAKSPGEDSASEADSISILVTEGLGRPPETTSSTIIGKQRDGSPAADSDIQLSGGGGAGSDIELVSGSGADSDLNLVAGSSDVLSGSDAKLKKSGSATGAMQLKPSGGSDVLTGSDAQLKKTGSATGEMKIKPSSGSDVLSGKEMTLKKSGSGTGDLELGGEELALGSDSLSLQDEDSALSLEADSDDELVLGGSGAGSGVGSDVSLDPQGSGINLGKPTDSGLNLADEPLELGGSAVESLELPEDEDVISLDDAAADPEQATQLKADEEFLLSPMDEGAMDDSSDSGSQVIALEDSDAFDENAVTMLKPTAGAPTFGEAPLLTEDAGDVMGQQLAGLGAGAGGMTATMAAPTQHHVSPAEAPYRVYEVLMLIAPVMTLTVAGMLMFDVLRNMWSFDSTTSASTSIMETVLGMFNLK